MYGHKKLETFRALTTDCDENDSYTRTATANRNQKYTIQTKLKFYYISHSEFRESRNPLSSWCYNFKPHYKSIIIIIIIYTQISESNSDAGEIFRNRPDRPWGPTSLKYKRYRLLEQAPHPAPRLKEE
jgi:hypothetical protein